MRFIVALAAGLCWFTANSVLARDIYVNNAIGDDRSGGSLAASSGTAGGPCRSISKALRIAQPSDRIIVANTGQPYRESITLQGGLHSGDDRFPFQIIGNGQTLDGSTSLAEASWEFVAGDTFRTRPQRMSYQQLFLDDQPAVRKQPAPGQPVVLAPREWCSLGGWIYFRVETGKLPLSYNLSCCGQQTGITLYEVHDVIVEDLTIRGFQIDGVNCHDNVRRTDLVRLTAKENGRSGIAICGSSRVRIDTCTAAGNGAAQVHIEGFCLVQMLDNMLDATSAPPILRSGGKIVEGL